MPPGCWSPGRPLRRRREVDASCIGDRQPRGSHPQPPLHRLRPQPQLQAVVPHAAYSRRPAGSAASQSAPRPLGVAGKSALAAGNPETAGIACASARGRPHSDGLPLALRAGHQGGFGGAQGVLDARIIRQTQLALKAALEGPLACRRGDPFPWPAHLEAHRRLGRLDVRRD